jgi:hypothetical protein
MSGARRARWLIAAALAASGAAGCGSSHGGSRALARIEQRLKVVGIPFRPAPVSGKATAGIVSRGVEVWAYPSAADAAAGQGGAGPALARTPNRVLVEAHGSRVYFLVAPKPITPVYKAQFDEIVGVGEG